MSHGAAVHSQDDHLYAEMPEKMDPCKAHVKKNKVNVAALPAAPPCTTMPTHQNLSTFYILLPFERLQPEMLPSCHLRKAIFILGYLSIALLCNMFVLGLC